MRVEADDFARPCSCGRNHHVDVKEILIESGAVNALEEAMSDGFLKNYISPLLICDTNTKKATAAKTTDAKFIKFEIDESNRKTPMRFGIRSIPSILAFKNGELVEARTGVMDEDTLLDWIQELKGVE